MQFQFHINPSLLLFLALNISDLAGKTDNKKQPFVPPREVHVQKTHSMPPEKREVFHSLNDWAENELLVLLKPVEKCWQPNDFLLVLTCLKV
ncbi:hypothetical protein Leryth_019028 [Lithospermum erythrorhizon]|nr:hypothetical protein Leryth_019028 [Lithospermum erythrorhizon]